MSERIRRLSPLLVAVAVALACGGANGDEPEELSTAQLQEIQIEGGISPHLPIRFSAMVHNRLEDLELRSLTLEVAGRRHEITRRVAPGSSRRLSFQWVYPEHPEWENAGSEPVDWTLLTATAATPRAN